MDIGENIGKAPALRIRMNNGLLPLKETLELCLATSTALAKLHKENNMHGAINPDTILMEEQKDGLISFLPGTLQELAYISPEQTGRIARKPDTRADLYAFGVTMYELLTGEVPFKGNDDMEIVHAHIAITPAPPGSVNASVPDAISAIVLRLLGKSPGTRYQTAAGLAADLQTCLSMLVETGYISGFIPGKLDVPDHIIIPQKLYGREKEIARLQQAYEAAGKGYQQTVFISGYSGIGKTALVRELQKAAVKEGAMFVSGKYDQFRRDIPYTAMVQGLHQWISLLLSEDKEKIAETGRAISASLGDGAAVLIQLVPELELIIGPQAAAPPLSPPESQNRFQLLILRLITAGTGFTQPLILFLDDLQWADVPSLKLLEFITADSTAKRFCLVASYRSNEVNGTHPLVSTIDEMRGRQQLNEIYLNELGEDSVCRIVADVLHCPEEKVGQLASAIYNKTAGNPFFINEFIKSMADEGLLTFDYLNRQWSWDIQKINERKITDNVVDLMVAKINKLPQATVQASRFAACLGNTFSLRLLAAINEKPEEETAADLLPMIEEGLISPLYNNEQQQLPKSYVFMHDRVQQASTATLPGPEREKMHLHAARAMVRYYNNEVPPDALFDVVNQYFLGAALIVDQREKKYLAQLAFASGHRAKLSAAFEPSYRYFKMALAQTAADLWENDYAFALSLHNETAEMAYLSGDVEAMEQLTRTVILKSHNSYDRVQAYSVRINAYTSLTRNAEALQECLTVLKELGIHFPRRPNKLHIIRELIATKLRLRGKTPGSFKALPELTNRHYLAVMDILAASTAPAYFVNQNLFPLIAFKEIEISLKHGISRHSAFAFATYGIIMCGSTQEFEEGQKYAGIARNMMYRTGGKDQEARILFVEENFIRHWSRPYIEMKEGALLGFHSGMDTGDFLYAGYNAFNYSNALFYSGFPLSALNDDIARYVSLLRNLKQSTGNGWVSVFKQTVVNLSSSSPSTKLAGDDYNETIMIPAQEKGNDHSGLCVAWLCKAILSYLLQENPEEALLQIRKSEQYLEHILATPHVVSVHFYSALIHLRSVKKISGIQKTAALQKAGGICKKLRKWAKGSPANAAAKLYIVEAELWRIKGKTGAEGLYLKAAAAANATGYLHEEALAKELLGKYYLSMSDERSSAVLSEAAALYKKWGANAKLSQMQALYPQLKLSGGLKETFSKGFSLDLQSILKASQIISGEVQLASLLQKLSRIIIENAGATSGTFLLKGKDGNWGIAAQAGTEAAGNAVYQDYLPLHNSKLVAGSVVNYVLSTREAVVVQDARNDDTFMHDAFIAAGAARSLLCFPVLQGGDVMLIIYLQNNLMTGAFTNERIQALHLLSGQIAISIENSLLYNTLEQKVEERTGQLKAEKQKSDDLLRNILPAEVAEELKRKGEIEACLYDDVSVLFTDFVNFTGNAEKLSPKALVLQLHECFSAFDAIVEKNGLEKIKTIGDAYMAVCGLPLVAEGHAGKAVQAAVEIRDFMIERKKTKDTFDIRIGVHSGPVVAGIVGVKKFAYDIWGDTVNTAARMEQNCEPGKVNISGITYKLVKNDFTCTYRGKINAKNKGDLHMYYVDTGGDGAPVESDVTG